MKHQQEIKKILVIQLKHLGDVLLSTPVIDALASTYPSAKISILINSGMEEMVSGHPHLHEVLTLPPKLRQEGGFTRIRKEWSLMRDIRSRKFDLAINLSRGDRGGWISVFSGARNRLGFKVASQEPGYKNWFYNLPVEQPIESIHEVEKNLRLLEGLELSPEPSPLTFAIPHETKDWADTELAGFADRPIVHVHPSSRWMFKCWDPRSMGSVIAHLREHGHRVVISCGPAPDEIKHCEAILGHAPVDRQYLGTLNLKQLGALIAKAKVFLGVDSAPMHIAAAVGTPTIALFGPTGAENWSPWQVSSVVLQKPCPCKEARAEKCDWRKDAVRACLAAIGTHEVLSAIHRLEVAPR